MINLICGFGRCGSSLVMQMIHATGAPVGGIYPMFETGASSVCVPDGFSVKILQPLTIGIPQGEYRIVWLDREPIEQAKSEVKFLSALGMVRDEVSPASVAQLHRQQRTMAIKRLSNHGKVLQIAFEDLISKRQTVEKLASFLKLSPVDKMLEQIIPRSGACQPSLDIEIELARKVALKT